MYFWSMKQIRSIALIGYGHVGRAFVKFFLNEGLEQVTLCVRESKGSQFPDLPGNVRLVHHTKDIGAVDFVLICVRDQEVRAVVEQLPIETPIAYTSGSILLSELSTRHRVGVFYPLQSFAGIAEDNVRRIPILIEARDEEMSGFLRDFALQHFDTVQAMSSEDRAKLHIAAVMVNNFVNHLFTLAHDWTVANQLDFNLLLPLIHETVQKIMDHSPASVQTGPAKRGDFQVVQRHLDLLDGRTKELYGLFSQSISERNQNN